MSRSTFRIGLSLFPLENLGGTGVYTEQLLRVLKDRTGSSGLDIVPIVPKGFRRSLAGFPEVRVRGILALRWPLRFAGSWLTKELFVGLDAIHYPTGVGPPLSTVPTIATIHDVSPFLCPQTMPWRRALYLRKMFTHLASCSRIILADTEWQAARLKEVFPTARDRIRTLYPALNPIYFQETAEEDLPESVRGKDYLLAVGTLEPRKNLIPLLQDWSRSEFDADLLLVGAWGWKTNPLRKALAEVGTSDPSHVGVESWRLPDGRSVLHLTRLADTNLAALYRKAFALVSASSFEGFGLPVAEAMAVGCPVITRGDSAMAEVAGKSAWLFDPEDRDSLGSVLRNIATRETERGIRIEYGKARAQMYSDEPFWQRLSRAYGETMGANFPQ